MDTVYRFRADDALSIQAVGNGLSVKSVYGFSDTLYSATLAGSGLKPSFVVRSGTETKDHNYFDGLKMEAKNSVLEVANRVNMERYVSRVVISEVGYGANEEYYKIQSIICRTYAARHLGRHAAEGFDLCDNEHCQVFSGFKKETNEVVRATASTNGLVMIDPKEQLILSAFHANCGGQTANSEDVWKESRTYLVSVEDTFCHSGRSSNWQKTMPAQDLLAQIGFSSNTSEFSNFEFDQTDRKKYFTLGSDSLEIAEMRKMLQLRSTLFNLEFRDGNAVFHGRGYGHGVGLCQQGSMKMAEFGYNYSQILGYYFKGVSLVSLSALPGKK
jgi:stage II sporulation protein D